MAGILGKTIDEVIGHKLEEFVPPEIAAAIREDTKA
jgi:hypothetical protein